jgi:hypothetical protein
MRPGALRVALGVLVAGVAIVWIGALWGLWWVTVPVGLAVGGIVQSARPALLLALVAGAAGWAGPLAWQSLSVDSMRTAAVVSGIMGAGSNGWTIILFSLCLAALLCAVGAWVSLALGGVVRAFRAPSGVAPAGPIRPRGR